MNNNELQQHLILLRGLPGAGKSTFARLISENGAYPTFSVDDYFTDEQGNYHFNFAENYKAYSQCLKHTESAIIARHSKVIVHNTFTMDWELEPYFKLSETYGCRLYVMTLENYHHKHNVHNISEEQIQKMAEKYRVKLF